MEIGVDVPVSGIATLEGLEQSSPEAVYRWTAEGQACVCVAEAPLHISMRGGLLPPLVKIDVRWPKEVLDDNMRRDVELWKRP